MKVPSVGKYEIKSTIGEGAPKISFSQKFPYNKKLLDNKVPGPGNYDPLIEHIKLRHPKYTMRAKTVTSTKSKPTPGVGIYNIDKPRNLYKSQEIKFGSEKKFRLNKFTYQTNPAPNKYKIKDDIEISTNRKVKINPLHKNKRKVNNYKDVPGPGTYIKVDKENDSAKIHMSFHRPMSAMFMSNKNPGPGQYESTLKNKRTAPSIT